MRDDEVVAAARPPRRAPRVPPSVPRSAATARAPGEVDRRDVRRDHRAPRSSRSSATAAADPAAGAGDRGAAVKSKVRSFRGRAAGGAGRSRRRRSAAGPRTTSCQNDSTLSSTSPLLTTPMTSTPRIVPMIEPRPPARLAPPRIDRGHRRELEPDRRVARALARSARRRGGPVSPTARPESTKAKKITRRVRIPARRAAVGFAPIAYSERPYVVVRITKHRDERRSRRRSRPSTGCSGTAGRCRAS